MYQTTNSEQLLERCQHAEVIVTNKVKLDATSLAQLAKLKLICVAATGVNNVDLDAAKAQQVAVTNVAGYSTPSVVQHTFTMLGNLLTNIHRYQQDCQAGRWQQSDIFCRLDYPIAEIHNKNFVIVGYGALVKPLLVLPTPLVPMSLSQSAKGPLKCVLDAKRLHKH